MSINPVNTTAVALSGGIDSLVSAFLLKEQGTDIFGVHFITGYESDPGPGSARLRVSHLSRLLHIEIHVIDIRKTFEKDVVDYFVHSYLSGTTPNPCMVCNRTIKFGIMLDEAVRLGAGRLATGHYARTGYDRENRIVLQAGVDPEKDQSYFLSMLNHRQLEQACFVLGERTKAEVRKIAAENSLQPIFKRESQDICFIRDQTCQDFLLSKLQTRPEPGDIVDAGGNRIGRHQGLFRYTIGQRRGINCPAVHPYYVLRLDAARNELVVGFKEALYRSQCHVSDMNWIMPRPRDPIRVKTRIRYRSRAVDSLLTPAGETNAVIDFETPQDAVTPGQAAVCYQGDAVVAGGWITG